MSGIRQSPGAAGAVTTPSCPRPDFLPRRPPGAYLRSVPHRTSLAALLALALAGCASSGEAAAPAPSDGSESVAAGTLELPTASGPGLRFGWKNLKPAEKRGQVMDLILLSESSKEGKLISTKGYSMDGGKVITDKDAAEMLIAFEKYGFNRFAVRTGPNEGPTGALGVVWMDRGKGIESLFLTPGARHNTDTKDLPDIYGDLKKLIWSVHVNTPGSSVRVGKGWSGEDLLNQKPGETHR